MQRSFGPEEVGDTAATVFHCSLIMFPSPDSFCRYLGWQLAPCWLGKFIRGRHWPPFAPDPEGNTAFTPTLFESRPALWAPNEMNSNNFPTQGEVKVSHFRRRNLRLCNCVCCYNTIQLLKWDFYKGWPEGVEEFLCSQTRDMDTDSALRLEIPLSLKRMKRKREGEYSPVAHITLK